MPGQIIAIFVAPTKHAGQIEVEEIQLKTGKGIVGDRFFGFSRKNPGRNLTMIEAEAISEFNQAYGQNCKLDATRRNIVTQNIRLNNLIGKQFRIGEVLCQGIELCEPCRLLVKNLRCRYVSQEHIIKVFTHKAGIRAHVLAGGIIRLNDMIFTETEPEN